MARCGDHAYSIAVQQIVVAPEPQLCVVEHVNITGYNETQHIVTTTTTLYALLLCAVSAVLGFVLRDRVKRRHKIHPRHPEFKALTVSQDTAPCTPVESTPRTHFIPEYARDEWRKELLPPFQLCIVRMFVQVPYKDMSHCIQVSILDQPEVTADVISDFTAPTLPSAYRLQV
jgi:hypothetical protein